MDYIDAITFREIKLHSEFTIENDIIASRIKNGSYDRRALCGFILHFLDNEIVILILSKLWRVRYGIQKPIAYTSILDTINN